MNKKDENNNHIDDLLKEQLYDEKFSLKIKNLERKQPPDNLWLKIEHEMVNSGIKPVSGFSIKVSSLFKFNTGFKKFALAGSAFIFLIIIGYYFYNYGSNLSNRTGVKSVEIAQFYSIPNLKIDTIKNNNNSQTYTISKDKFVLPKNPAEKDFDTLKYQHKINKLLTSAEIKKIDMDPYIKSIYNERLASIDESINECKSNLADNGLNNVVRKSLILAYGEKVKVLLDILKN
jgi:hypothetical protein